MTRKRGGDGSDYGSNELVGMGRCAAGRYNFGKNIQVLCRSLGIDKLSN